MSAPVRSSTRIFFYLVYLFLAFVWYVAMALPAWRPMPVLIPFTLLMGVHGAAHGFAETAQDRGWTAHYILLQSLLALALVWLAGGDSLSQALFAPIAGETAGFYSRPRERALALGAVVLAWGFAAALSGGVGSVLPMLPWVVGAMGIAALYAVLYLKQAEQRARAESLLAQLEVANQRLRAYAHQVEELSVTEERQRMARELHDTLAQGLAGLTMQLEAADDLLGRGDSERARTIIRRAMERTRGSIAEARATIQALRLPLERGDLLEELRRELDRLRQDGGLETIFEVGPGKVTVAPEVARQLFRIAQEGLSNVLRHSRARTVTMRLWSDEEAVHLEIVDDGVGFDPAGAASQAGHYGLTGMGERARLAGGALSIESRPGEGTRLEVTLSGFGRSGHEHTGSNSDR